MIHPTLTSIATKAETEFNDAARETALHDARAMNAWQRARKALVELKAMAVIIDEVARAG